MVLLPKRHGFPFFRITADVRSSGLSTGTGLDQHAHDVAFLHDQVFDAVDLDFGARPLAE
jgi:hypothetical protein